MRSVISSVSAKSVKHGLGFLITVPLLASLMLAVSPAWAVEILSPSDCAGMFNPNLSCTSNDIKINDVSQMTEAEGGQAPIATCNEGDTGLVDIKLTTQLNATGRYDVLTWFGTEGNDPRGATVGNCYVTSLPGDPPDPAILDLEAGADACLDVNSSPTPVTQYMKQVPYTCQDLKSLDGGGNVVDVPDGEADVFALVTWFQNNSLSCGTGAGQSLEPGVNPKCDISLLLGLNIQIITSPEIQIVKTPPTQAVAPGGQADFTLTVTNIGDAVLETVNVTDGLCDAAPAYQSGDTGNDSIMDPLEAWVYTCSTTDVQAGFTNTADVTAVEQGTANQVGDSDTADVTLTAPSIQVVKSPATQSVNPGGTASFSIVVTNNGNQALTNVALTDALAPDCDTNIGDLAAGASTAPILCDVINVPAQGDFINQADVIGYPDGDPVTDSDTAAVTVTSPGVQIVKGPTQAVLVGGTAAFTLTVTNTGDVDLENVVVSDAMCDASPAYQSGDVGVDGVLGTAETWIYTCSIAGVQSGFTNDADVTADPVGGGDNVQDSDSADVSITVPPPEVPVPASGFWALLLLIMTVMGTGLYFRRRRS